MRSTDLPEAPAASFFDGLDVYDNVNPKIVELYAGENAILDVGCGAGALGERFKTLNPRAFVAGVDYAPEAETAARRRLDTFQRLDLDREPLPDFGRRFDLIVFGDVLEHLKRPDRLLASARTLLDPRTGRVIVSLPNVAQMRIRRRLLLGHFDYTPTGILDRTHLRFFTYATACELFTSCGFRIVDRRFITVRWTWLEKWLYRLVSTQFVFKLAPEGG
jgi:O-antigen biosynthesis protein